LKDCAESTLSDRVPARSWNDLASDITRCTLHEYTENWDQVLAIVEAADPEVARRQFKALRVSLLCARARALARLGRHGGADAALATALRSCPRGAIDPLIVLEASKALCLSLRGDHSQGDRFFERALGACRAIGHKYHEVWIERQRADLTTTLRSRISLGSRPPEEPDTTVLLGDVATALGAGHSVEVLAQRTLGILRSTPVGRRVKMVGDSGHPYLAVPACEAHTSADGAFELRLRGSDRRVVISVPDVTSLDEISLLKSVVDIVQAAVNRTADTETEDDDQNLWPRTMPAGDDDAVFRSPRMIELLKIATRLATTNVPVLITGETGTGKEILARLIHDESRSSRGPFVPFNCSSIPRELVESQLFGHRRGAFTGAMDSAAGVIRAAEHGTLFLDEIGDLDPATQPKLLRFLESGEIHPVGEPRSQRVQVRIVAATNADLDALVRRGRFRSDLYYRIGVATIALPPLRDRKDEIPALASLFVERYATECGRSHLRLSDDFIAALLLYDWPGNIRQLANEVRRVVALADDGQTITSQDLAPGIAAPWNDRPVASTRTSGPSVHVGLDQTLAAAIEDLEEKFIQHALASTGGRVADAARLLGLSRKGLFLKRRRRRLIAD
jgi:DNA-binding NtrC family response regulator